MRRAVRIDPRAAFVLIYNSTIGLEASIMGVPVLCAGSARFTDFGTVFFPASAKASRVATVTGGVAAFIVGIQRVSRAAELRGLYA